MDYNSVRSLFSVAQVFLLFNFIFLNWVGLRLDLIFCFGWFQVEFSRCQEKNNARFRKIK
jgi:hypothetical protein